MRITTIDQYRSEYQESVRAPEKFWAGIADNFTWRKKWDTTLRWNFNEPKVEWFINGKLNITENCLDRHLEKQGDRVAF